MNIHEMKRNNNDQTVRSIDKSGNYSVKQHLGRNRNEYI
jgi:hypothetical protein